MVQFLVRYVQYECYETTARSETHHAQMGRSMAHISHQPGPVCLESGVSRWLVGVVGLGVELHQRPQAARGALLTIRVP